MNGRPTWRDAALLAAVALAAGPSAARVLELPATLAAPGETVVLDLDAAVVEVVVDPSAEPVLVARLPVQDPAQGVRPAAARLRVEDGAGALVVRRDGDGREPLVIQLTLAPKQRLRVSGSALDVVLRELGGAAQPEDLEAAGSEGAVPPAPAGGAAGGAAYELEVERSNVQLFGVAAAAVTAVDSSVYGEAGSGALALDLRGGDVELRDHRGQLSLRGRDAEIWVGNLEGSLDLELVGGHLVVHDSRGQCTGTVQGGSLEIDGWIGPAKLHGVDARFEIRSPSEPRLLLTLTGIRLDAHAAPFLGALVANFRGGRLQVRDQQGSAKIRASEGAEVVCERCRGNLSLTLEDASLRVAEMAAGRLEINAIRSRVDLDQVPQLALIAAVSEVYARGLQQLTKAEATDSRLELDLSDLRHNPTLDLRGASTASVTLATPCTLKLSDEQLFASRIEVSGCDLEGRVARRNLAAERGVEGNRRVRLTVQLSEDSTVQVEGRP